MKIVVEDKTKKKKPIINIMIASGRVIRAYTAHLHLWAIPTIDLI